MTIDPVVGLEALGYTEREAAFLYLVATHSGYFLRRQFNCFVQRQKGYVAHHFIEKARIAGHVEVLDYGQGRFVYHVFAKTIYRLLGNPDSQNRRRKGDNSIRTRLMALDYILETENDHFFDTDDTKLDYFIRVRRISPELLTTEKGQLLPFLKAFPVSIADREQPISSVVHFAFIDEGLASIAKFERFLAELAPLFRTLQRFEVLYVATNKQNFGSAKPLFHKAFSSSATTRQQSFASFRAGDRSGDALQSTSLDASFTTLLFHYSYPKLSRNEPRGSAPESETDSQLKQQLTAFQPDNHQIINPSG